METRVSSRVKEVVIGDERPMVLIGERINPTGKLSLLAGLQAGSLEAVRRSALAQVRAGADILDVNVGAAGLDEVALLPKAVQAVIETVEVPLCLDSSNPEALEAALEVYRGKALITGEEDSLARVLPLVKEHGAAVIGLTMDDEGIPNDADRRVQIARKILTRAEALGIPREDIVIDGLTLTVGADSRAGLVTLATIRKIKAELGVNVTLAASNISFGLPDRDLLSGTFLAMAIALGASCAIVDVAKVRPVVLAADLALGRDDYAMRYVQAYRQRQKG